MTPKGHFQPPKHSVILFYDLCALQCWFVHSWKKITVRTNNIGVFFNLSPFCKITKTKKKTQAKKPSTVNIFVPTMRKWHVVNGSSENDTEVFCLVDGFLVVGGTETFGFACLLRPVILKWKTSKKNYILIHFLS